MDALLSESEMANWVAWKRATDAVMRAVANEIADTTGLSPADFSVLTRLVEEGNGTMRQQRLADELGWERSRLSRQLGRMEVRGLLSRKGSGPERWITATDSGADAVALARVAHARAVRRTVTDAIEASDRTTFWKTISRISAISDALQATY